MTPTLFSPSSLPALALGWGLFFAVSTALLSAIGFAWERSAKGRSRRIFDIPLPDGQLRREAVGNVRFVLLAAILFPAAVHCNLVRANASGALAAALTFALCFAGFEAFYYFFHRALHHPKLVRFHRWHHASRVTTPLSGQSLSTFESAGWLTGLLLVPMALSLVGLLHPWAFIAYVLANAAGNIVGHANAEMMPRDAGLREKSWATHPYTFHALHHARWTAHFGLGTTVLDRVLHTEWPDWPALHARVLDGKPMTSFKEKGDEP